MTVILDVIGIVIAFLITVALSALAGILKEEIRGWIEILPGIVLRMAARQLDFGQRITVYREEWLPELLFITRKAEGRLITKFATGMRFSFGLLRSSRQVARRLRTSFRGEVVEVPRSPRSRVATRAGMAIDTFAQTVAVTLKGTDSPVRVPPLHRWLTYVFLDRMVSVTQRHRT